MNTMKRIIPVLVALLFSGPVWAAENEVLLHCGGWKSINDEIVRRGTATNLKMAVDGSWLTWLGRKVERTRVANLKSFQWEYKVLNIGTQKEEIIHFDPSEMVMNLLGDERQIFLACFPIENPLKF